MSSIFFGPVAVVSWIIASLIFTFCATWVWAIVLEVGGVRGTALAILLTCLAIISICFALILMHQPWISTWLLGAIISAVFPPILFSVLILTDLYAASRNSHRSFTARSYEWYQNMLNDRHEKNNSRHSISSGG